MSASTTTDPERHFAKGGVMEALDEAKKSGNGCVMSVSPAYKQPSIHLKMLAHDYPFDAVQMPRSTPSTPPTAALSRRRCCPR